MGQYTEDQLVQATVADYLRDVLGWESVYAYNSETFGPEGTLGRKDDREVVLTRYLGEALMRLNPNLPMAAYQEAQRQLLDYSVSLSLAQTNRIQHDLIRDGVPVQFRNGKGELERRKLRVIDFDNPADNHFLAVRELWVRSVGGPYRRRPDIIGFVNGLPMLFVELKNIHKDLRRAYEGNLADYKDTIPQLFHHNAVVMLGNGQSGKIGSLTSRYGHFHEWKRLSEGAPGVVDMETLLKGVCSRRVFLDLFENFILFDESSGRLVKIVARNHQYLGVNQAVTAVQERKARLGKLGVFWHTQGSGKSYSMVLFARKVRRKLGGAFTFLVCTDRDDLDTQIYKTFAGCGLVDNDKDPCRAGSGDALKGLLTAHKAFVFTLVQKFNQDVKPEAPWSLRDDVIVMSDEAHRTQYGRLALNLRNALPGAAYIGFTGTPLFKEDEITRRVFGDYVSTYDFQRAVEDGATVPLYYDARGEKLAVTLGDINQRIAEKLEALEIEDVDVAARLERELSRDYHVITANDRLDRIAADFVQHYSTAWESGKAMFVCLDKITCVRMFDRVQVLWGQRIAELEKQLGKTQDEQEEQQRHRQLEWMRATRMAVVVSEEQGEMAKFERWGADITPHRALMKEGFETPDGKRLNLEDAFKEDEHPFRVVFVCAMWLTGFDVPSLATLYLDKPLKAHTLMQAIARANRVNDGKTNGLVVDYCGILRSLREALATFAGRDGDTGEDSGGDDPVKPAEEDLLATLEESLALANGFLAERQVGLAAIIEGKGFARIAAIAELKDAINKHPDDRKRFELLARDLFRRFRSCITLVQVNDYRHQHDAINIVYKSLQEDRDAADISAIIQDLHKVIDEAVQPLREPDPNAAESKLYDISKIDFERLRLEYTYRSKGLSNANTNLRDAIEKRLAQMLAQNPLRVDFQKRYEEMVDDYNREKDRLTIEQTFDALIAFVAALDQEGQRAIREGLDEESLALFDLLVKPSLAAAEIKRIKKVAVDLLDKLRAEMARVRDWRDKQATRDQMRMLIHDFLYSDTTGLPVDLYGEGDVDQRSELIYEFLMSSPGLESAAASTTIH